MPATSTRLANEKAPCGRIVEGERIMDDADEQCLLTDEVFYDCGCKSIRHEYHDGGFARKVVRHDGHILIDERSSGS